MSDTDPDSWLTNDRPNFGPSQVKTPQEITPDATYQFIQGGITRTIQIDDFPYQEKLDGHLVWVVCYHIVGEDKHHLVYLLDIGIVSHWDGRWHASNHMMRI